MPIPCPKCRAALPNYFFVAANLTPCPSCGAELAVRAFPALFAPPRQEGSGDPLLEGEAGCFYHPLKRAFVTCHLCGRFLCGLCNVEFKGRNWCPVCLETTSRKRKETDLENHRTLYDTLALALATAPFLVFFWPAAIGAPVALYVSIRHWNSPTSILPRTKIRFMLAIFFALAEIALFGFFIYFVLHLPRLR
jgi:hypothetical protein